MTQRKCGRTEILHVVHSMDVLRMFSFLPSHDSAPTRSSGADKEAIAKVHRKLMIVNHPDRGGSPYIAMKVITAAFLPYDSPQFFPGIPLFSSAL